MSTIFFISVDDIGLFNLSLASAIGHFSKMGVCLSYTLTSQTFGTLYMLYETW